MRRASGRRLAYGHLERALGYYSRYRRGEWVPHVYRAYLGALEEERAIEGYVTGLGGNERRAVGMYLDGKSARTIARDVEIVRGGAGLQDVRVWVYGSGERFGLLSVMYGVMMRKAEFCPFCHGGRSTGKGYMVRLHGSVCPHREIWEGERRRERGRG